jgi:lysophospholipase L1-like esterase
VLGQPPIANKFAALSSPQRLAESLVAALIFAVCQGLAGCSSSIDVRTSLPPVPATGFSGRVVGGQEPISGSSVQLYAVGTTGDKSAATPLLATTVTTSDGSGALNGNANAGNAKNTLPAGSFTLTGAYVCPSQSTQVYLVATGGNPGLSPGTNNPQISLVVVLGQCGSLSPTTYVDLNELTTVASIAPVINFMGSYAALGFGTADSTQFVTAVGQISEYTDTSSGAVPGPSLPSGYYASTYELRALANILAACVNSSGGTAGDTTVCGQLLKLATPTGGTAPTDIIQATLDILANPKSNVAALFNLVPAASPFQPALPAPPASWALPIVPNPTTFSTSLNSSTFFIGASIIDYWPMPLHKDGVVGDTSAQVLARFRSDVLNQGYARVIILCGTNDVLQGDPNLATELPANLQAMASMATSAGIEVVLSELPPLSGSFASLNPNIISANAAIAQMAAQNGYLVVDYYTPMAGHPEYFSDGIHPNASGYVVMEQALSSVVRY